MTSAARRRAARNAESDDWAAQCARAEQSFRNYLDGKTVVLVGPAASIAGRGQGAEIDSYDVVVRLNLSCPTPKAQAADLGSRTDVLYHVLFNPRLARAAGQQHTSRQIDSWVADGVKFVVTRQESDHDRVRRFRRVWNGQFPLVTMTADFKRPIRKACGTNPNTGTLAIAHLLSMPIRSLHVTGFDFYASAYHVGYGGFDAKRAAKGTGGGNWGMTTKVPHEQAGQMAWLAAINDPRLSWDRLAAERLGLVEPPPSVIALVPMKGHSERVPDKNIRDLCGKPLLFWALDALHRSRRVSQVVVDTDDDEIERLVLEHHPATTVIRRPDRMMGDQVNGNDLIRWELSQVKGDHFAQVHVTAPLLTPATIDGAVDRYFESDCDSLFTVAEHHFWLFDADGQPVNSDTRKLVRSQDLDPLFEDTNGIHLFSRKSFRSTGSRIGKTPEMFPIGKIEAVDIDDPEDFEIAEALLAQRLAR